MAAGAANGFGVGLALCHFGVGQEGGNVAPTQQQGQSK
jgi:hypothetical protein